MKNWKDEYVNMDWGSFRNGIKEGAFRRKYLNAYGLQIYPYEKLKVKRIRRKIVDLKLADLLEVLL